MDKSQVRSCLSASGSITYDPLTGVIGGSGGGGAAWGSITGTLSDQTDLQAALDALVPYTGATNDVDLNTFSLNAKSLHVKGTGGAGHLGLKHQSADATATANETSLFADSNGDLKTKNDALYYSTFKTSLNTADRTYTFPDANGTLALTNQLPTPAALTKVDDTNVTLTLGGTPATALLQATSLTLGWSGQLSVARGGTGLGTLGTANQLIRVNAGATALEYFTPTFLTGLTVGTTPIASGTVGRILFQGTGNVLQQASNLFWDNTNSRLSLAFGASPSARLDILNTGTTASDLALRVRDNGNTFNNFAIRGNGVAVFAGFSANAGYIVPFNSGGTTGFILTTENLAPNPSSVTLANIFITDGYIQTRASTSGVSRRVLRFETAYTGSDPDWVMASYGGDVGGSLALGKVAGTAMFAWSAEKVFSIAPNAYLNNGTNQLRIVNGTAPTATLTDGFSLYSADIVAGNAAPHFRTEGGDVVKLYSVGGWGTPTGTLTRTTFATYGGATAGVLYDQTIMQNLIDAVKINSERLAALISDLKTGHQLLKA